MILTGAATSINRLFCSYAFTTTSPNVFVESVCSSCEKQIDEINIEITRQYRVGFMDLG